MTIESWKAMVADLFMQPPSGPQFAADLADACARLWPGAIPASPSARCPECGGSMPAMPVLRLRDGAEVCSTDCRTAGMVPCPAVHARATTCPLCKGADWIEEI